MSLKILKIKNFFLEKFKKDLAKNYLFLALFSSFVALISAYISQYIFGFEPCVLCYHQRKPFFIIIIIALFFLLIKKLKKYQKIGAILCALAFLINAGIAFYHSGVELKIFAGPDSCSSSNFDNIDNVEQLREALFKTKAIRCDEPQFYFLNLTMANWNFIYCLGLGLVLFLIFLQRNKSKKT
jgi:disulfide bond formation protein DsbB